MAATTLLDIRVLDHGATRLIRLTGEFDMACAGRARALVREALLGDPETVVLDLAGLTFMDSSGVHLALDAAGLAERRHVRFVVVPGPPHVQAVFEFAGVEATVPFARSGGRFAR